MEAEEKNNLKNEDLDLDEAISYENEDILDEEEGYQDKIKKLREKLKECEKEKQEYLLGWQRTKADFVNQKKEEEVWKKDFVGFANKNLIDELLTVVDSFNFAFSNKEAWEKVDKNWRVGVEYIYSQLFEILKGHGLETFGTEGELFNPSLHNAVEMIDTEDENMDHKISSVLQKGFKLKEKIIRPARVNVFNFKKS